MGITPMNPQQLVETALHVLVAWSDGLKPAAADLETLKTAFPVSAHLPVDELACQVIHDLSGRFLPETEQDTQAQRLMDDVA